MGPLKFEYNCGGPTDNPLSRGGAGDARADKNEQETNFSINDHCARICSAMPKHVEQKDNLSAKPC